MEALGMKMLNYKEKQDNKKMYQQCVVYYFYCNLCDADYFGYTCGHLYQCVEEHKGSSIGSHQRSTWENPK